MNEATQKWFNGWSNEYDRTLGKMKRHHEMLDLAVKMSKVQDGDNILDIGCGTGLLSLKFLEAASCIVQGVDLSEAMVNVWKDKIEKLNLSTRVKTQIGDASNLDFEDSTFDIIASTVTLHHLKDKQPTLNKIYRLLKPKGRLVIGEVDIDTSGDLNDVERLQHIMDFLKEELSMALRDGGLDALIRLYDNGKKVILNDGEYCISLKIWARLCEEAGFKHLNVKPVESYPRIKVLYAEK